MQATETAQKSVNLPFLTWKRLPQSYNQPNYLSYSALDECTKILTEKSTFQPFAIMIFLSLTMVFFCNLPTCIFCNCGLWFLFHLLCARNVCSTKCTWIFMWLYIFVMSNQKTDVSLSGGPSHLVGAPLNKSGLMCRSWAVTTEISEKRHFLV